MAERETEPKPKLTLEEAREIARKALAEPSGKKERRTDAPLRSASFTIPKT